MNFLWSFVRLYYLYYSMFMEVAVCKRGASTISTHERQ